MVFVISKGWNQYQFEKYAPMINGTISIPDEDKATYEKNRNLFYVCCSRPKKRLVIFITVPVNQDLNNFLTSVVGTNNIYTYSQFMANLNDNTNFLI